MLSLFGSKLPIDEDELEFQLATFKWLIGEFGDLSESVLILPTPEFFPSARSRRHVPAQLLFDDVRRATGMQDWRCVLEEGDSASETDAGNAHHLVHGGPSSPCGTFSLAEDKDGYYAVITYDPALENDQQALVATFAHELAHYLLTNARGTPPGGWELEELHTDIAAVYLGFGIFVVNSAWSFAQYQKGAAGGWTSRTQGYLSEAALTVALAIYQRLIGRDPAEAAPYVEDYLPPVLRRAGAWLAKRHPDMAAAVEAVDLAPYGSDFGEPEESLPP